MRVTLRAHGRKTQMLSAIVRAAMVVVAMAVAVAARYPAKYQVVVQRVNNQQPLFTKGASIFDYNYNPTVVAPIVSSATGNRVLPTPGIPTGLLVRCQNNNTGWRVTPSELAFSTLATPIDVNDVHWTPIAAADVVLQPSGPSDDYGDEDPRVVYRAADQQYYLLYSAVETQQDGSVSCLLSMATSATPHVPGSWTRRGPVVPQLDWSKSGALLIRDGLSGTNDAAAATSTATNRSDAATDADASSLHYLFFGDSSKVNGLQVATTSDLHNFTLWHDGAIWLPMRDPAQYFDSALVEAGPMPLRLSDGNYLLLYNSARHGYPSPKPNWDLQYNVGYAVLDGTDPTTILDRSDEPIFSPQLDWEIGNDLLTPNVVFAEGWYPLDTPNTFLMFYGAADTYVGAAVVSVFIDDA